MKFKKWITLQSILGEIHEAADAKSLSEGLIEFASAAISVPQEEIREYRWEQVATIFGNTLPEIDDKGNIPMFVYTPETKEEKQKMNWDYRGREYFAMSHQICKTYGWTLEYVEELDHLQILSLLQEIEIETQFQREWEWNLSDKSTSYNPNTKKSMYVPLGKPAWMKQKVEPPKKILIAKHTLPVGNIINLEELD